MTWPCAEGNPPQGAVHGGSVANKVTAFATDLARAERIFVLTGAGCSTAAGIPDYRGLDGAWKLKPPVLLQDFLNQHEARQRYWARSLVGWPRFHAARPAPVHRALTQLEESELVNVIVTQNVDGLHQRAGSANVIDLHGNLSAVSCLECGEPSSREQIQQQLAAQNPGISSASVASRPDGDAMVDKALYSGFTVPECDACGGLLKPDVVFFGENVPQSRVDTAMTALAIADTLLVVGSSLMVLSSYRFCQRAKLLGKPIYIINQGHTRADADAALKLEHDCNLVLPQLVQMLKAQRQN